MKPTFLKTFVRNFCLVLMLAASLLGISSLPASAQTNYSSEEINNAILLPGSIRPEWVQPTNGAPWQISDNKLYPYVYNPLTFMYVSEKPTMIEIGALETNTQFILTENGTSLLNVNVGTTGYGKLLKMPAGAHVISIQQNSSYYNRPTTDHIYSLGIYECDKSCDLSGLLNAKSMPIEIINDSITPWYMDGAGNCKTSFTNQVYQDIPLKIRFTVDKPARLSWVYSVQPKNTNVSSNNGLGGKVTIFEECDSTYLNTNNYWEVFEPGTHEVTFYGGQYKGNSSYSNYGFKQISLRNIGLTSEWFEVSTTPGDLGNSVIDEIIKANYTSLRDVRFLKVRGKMNSTDWTTVKNMYNIHCLDLSETEISNIPARQFDSNSSIRSITLPQSVETIGNSAFRNTKLRLINFTAEIKSIGDSAFYATSIPRVSFPENSRLKYMGSYAFNRCSALKSVELPDSLTSFKTYSMYMCWEHRSDSPGYNSWMVYPSSRYSDAWSAEYPTYYNLVYSGAFAECSKLKTIKFPANLVYIPGGICFKCTELESVVFPKRLKTIAVASFLYTNLNEITLPDSLTIINKHAFALAVGDKECKLTLPESIRVITNDAFYRGNISEANFPEGLHTIESNAFNSNKFTDVKLPLRLSVLDVGAFYGNTRMKRFQLHAGAKGLRSVVDGCKALETIVLPCATPPTLASNATFVGTLDKKKIKLIVPEFAHSSYLLDSYWYGFGSITSGAEATDHSYWPVLGDLRLREGRRMVGTPDVDIAKGASMTILGSTPATFGKISLDCEPYYYYKSSSSSSATEYASYPSFVNGCVNTTVEKFDLRCTMRAGQWYMLTPLYDVNISDIKMTPESGTTAPNFVWRYYDAMQRATGYANTSSSSPNWRNVTDNTLRAGQGYIFQADAAGTLIFPEVSGATSNLLTTTEMQVELKEAASTNTANAHWNFIGNPYPAYFDTWYLNLEAPITVYTKTGTGTISYKAVSLTDDNYILSPMEPFFVQKPAGVDAAKFGIEGRSATKTIGDREGQRVKRQRRDDPSRKLFNVELLDAEGQSIDQTRVVINEKAMLDYEIACDASKFMAEAGAQIYTIDPQGNRMAINERPLDNGIVALGIRAGNEHSYTIAATRADGNVWLRDELTGDEIDITTSPYVVNCKANTSIEGRFSLRFAPIQTGIIDPAQKARVESGVGYIAVENPAEAEVAIFNASGIEAMRSTERSIRHELPAGIYMVRIGADTHKLIVK